MANEVRFRTPDGSTSDALLKDLMLSWTFSNN